jgi:hypothetical protein
MNIAYIVLLLACVVVALILLRGLWNMLQNGPGNKSQKLMRMRVIAQAIAVILMVGFVYFSRG